MPDAADTPFEDAHDPSGPLRPVIELVHGRVEARWPEERPGTGIAVDYAAIRFPDGPDSVRGMPLVRACGRDRARAGVRLVDATAGLGYDAFVLALAGFDVVAIERSPDVFRLLSDGIERAKHPRLRAVEGEASAMLATLAPDIVYLDPMYPAKRRASALPPKEMQLVRALVGDDLDAATLFDAACRAASRVVVKRPLHAESFGKPAHSIEGKLVRFDVYLGQRVQLSKGEAKA